MEWMWTKGLGNREMLWRFLKKYTAGDARKIVSSVSDRNGWEAWRKLHLQFEPALVMREAVVMAQFTSMVNKRANTPAETKTLLVELDERAKRFEGITGGRIDNRHTMSVAMGILDSETMKHTVQRQWVKSESRCLEEKSGGIRKSHVNRKEWTRCDGYRKSRDEDEVGRSGRRVGRR